MRHNAAHFGTGWGAVTLVFGAAAVVIVAAWMAFADDIYLSRLTAFVLSCF